MIYTEEEELLYKKSGEQCECMGILHQLSQKKYNMFSIATNIPVIVLSSAIGFISSLQLFNNQNVMLGVLSILVSLVKSLDNYFDFTRRAENHRLTSLNYSKIAKLIEIQLTLKREDRIDAEDLLNIISNDVASLRESEPTIDKDIINTFNKKYYKDLTSKPSIANGLTDIKIYRSKTCTAETQVDIEVESEVESEPELNQKPETPEVPRRLPIWKR